MKRKERTYALDNELERSKIVFTLANPGEVGIGPGGGSEASSDLEGCEREAEQRLESWKLHSEGLGMIALRVKSEL